jgi:glycosyltransferase involved in cell wall biosynthesis
MRAELEGGQDHQDQLLPVPLLRPADLPRWGSDTSDVSSITPLPIEPHQGRSFRIGYFGTWSDKDGFIDMLEAVRLLRERNRRVELWAAGTPHSDRYMRRIRAFLEEPKPGNK